ncbi:LysR family transcriptional regulator [Acetobacter oeni]|uniref:Transcriptional regulator, LysR family protein n=1 Tax=Acetobacter oeni TaxID=304077 RepID=A0A511XMM7_9PROT|nr:LysR family transcriptional regulator [Acetobacter oeni]MBB3884150.1 DNA-binding transcriptional LysR family regulator [Acetobacter oeni]NHO20152.1 LysR family transcriptional regulator [Acetobacter oeni]GBR04384.1 LysR family transcriptional regulator [Acetobacter oeni LMG 21952]GEN64203.1 transcriptional regulator, LysR family protein [Acetobacter oeni]
MFLRQLTYLIALDQYRHFSRAAEHCGVSQPALSAAIRQLEHELGVTIVRRNRRMFGLTPEGERVLAWARQTVADLDSLRQEAAFAQDVAGGSISLGVMPPAIQVVPLLLESLRAAVPALHVEVTVFSSSDILRELREHRIQLGLMYLDQVPVDGAFETREMYAEQHVLAAAGGIVLPGRGACDWAAAASVPLCLLSRPMRSRQMVDACFREAGVSPSVMLETNALELLHSEVLSGRLATILPVAALPAGAPEGGPLQVRRLDPSPAPGVGLVRVKQTVATALMVRAWEIVSGLSLGEAFRF